MASGVQVEDEVVQAFDDIKIGHKHKFALFKLSDSLETIGVEKTVDAGDWATFIAELPKDDCRYALFDFDYTLQDGGKRNKLVFVVWCPDSSKIKKKMLYASSKDALRKKLNGVSFELQATDLDELDYDDVFNKISAGGTK